MGAETTRFGLQIENWKLEIWNSWCDQEDEFVAWAFMILTAKYAKYAKGNREIRSCASWQAKDREED